MICLAAYLTGESVVRIGSAWVGGEPMGSAVGVLLFLTLTFTGLLMLVVLAASLAGLWLDPRVITGAPAWLKPVKFAISIAIYTLTLVWVFTYLPEWARTRRAFAPALRGLH